MGGVDIHAIHIRHNEIEAGDQVRVTYNTFPKPIVRYGVCKGWRHYYGDDWLCLVQYNGMRTFIAKVRATNVAKADAVVPVEFVQ